MFTADTFILIFIEIIAARLLEVLLRLAQVHWSRMRSR